MQLTWNSAPPKPNTCTLPFESVYIARPIAPSDLTFPNPEYRQRILTTYVSRTLTSLSSVDILSDSYSRIRPLLQVIQNPVNEAGACGVSSCNCGDSYVLAFGNSQR